MSCHGLQLIVGLVVFRSLQLFLHQYFLLKQLNSSILHSLHHCRVPDSHVAVKPVAATQIVETWLVVQEFLQELVVCLAEKLLLVNRIRQRLRGLTRAALTGVDYKQFKELHHFLKGKLLQSLHELIEH